VPNPDGTASPPPSATRGGGLMAAEGAEEKLAIHSASQLARNFVAISTAREPSKGTLLGVRTNHRGGPT
jgi:hypothetical protein